jgi:hypothetical protein
MSKELPEGNEEMDARPRTPRCVFLPVVLGAMFLAGCIHAPVSYLPSEHMIVVEDSNHFLWAGPCGAPWNYHDYFDILLQEGLDQCEAPQLEMYGDFGKLTIHSGYVSINRAKKTVTINLVLLALVDIDHVSRPFQCNGTYKYVEQELSPAYSSRKWLQDFYRDKEPSFYFPH